MPQTEFTTKEIEVKLTDAKQVMDQLLAFRRPYEPMWANLHSQFIGIGETRRYPDGSPRANVFVPYPFANVRHVKASVMEALFSFDPPFETLPGGLKDTEAALKMQRVLEILALRKGRLRQAISDYLGWLAIYGWAALDVGWDWDYDLVYDHKDEVAAAPDGSLILDPMTGQPLIVRKRITRPVPRQCPKFTALDIYDVAVDPDGAYICKFFDKTLPQLIRENEVAEAAGYKLYDNAALVDLAEQLRKGGGSESSLNSILRIAELWNATDGTFTLFTTPQDVTSLSFKDRRYANRSAGYAQYRRQVATGLSQKLLAAGSNPYAHCRVPILASSYTQLPGETYGMGVIEPAYGVQNALCKTLSMIEDIWDFGVNQRFMYDISRDIDLGDLRHVNVPGGLVGVYGPTNNALQEIPTHAPERGAYDIIPLFQSQIEVAANVSDPYNRGIGAPSGNRTATGIQTVLQQANKGLVLVIMQLSETILEPVLQMTASNIQQFVTDDLEIRVTDEAPAIPKLQSRFLPVSPADLAGSFDFRIVGTVYLENRFAQQNNARLLFQLSAQAAPEYVKISSSLAELYRIHRIPYPHRFIKTEEEVQMENMMALQQQMATQRMAPLEAGSPKRPQQTVDYNTGAVRQEAQMQGANSLGMGTPGTGGMNVPF